jgi:hypothetical protein
MPRPRKFENERGVRAEIAGRMFLKTYNESSGALSKEYSISASTVFKIRDEFAQDQPEAKAAALRFYNSNPPSSQLFQPAASKYHNKDGNDDAIPAVNVSGIDARPKRNKGSIQHTAAIIGTRDFFLPDHQFYALSRQLLVPAAMSPELHGQFQQPSSSSRSPLEPPFKEAVQQSGVQQHLSHVATISVSTELVERVQKRMQEIEGGSASHRVLTKLQSEGIRTKEDLQSSLWADFKARKWDDAEIDVVMLEDDVWAKKHWGKDLMYRILGDLEKKMQDDVLDIFRQQGIQDESDLRRRIEQLVLPVLAKSRIRSWAMQSPPIECQGCQAGSSQLESAALNDIVEGYVDAMAAAANTSGQSKGSRQFVPDPFDYVHETRSELKDTRSRMRGTDKIAEQDARGYHDSVYYKGVTTDSDLREHSRPQEAEGLLGDRSVLAQQLQAKSAVAGAPGSVTSVAGAGHGAESLSAAQLQNRVGGSLPFNQGNIFICVLSFLIS